MVAAVDYCIGLGGTVVVADLASSDVEVGVSPGPLAVEAHQELRTFRNRL